MATRLEPFRDYSEHEVVNLFALDTEGVTAADLRGWKAGSAAGGVNDAGVAVAVKAGAELPGDLPSTAALKGGDTDVLRNYLGASGQPHVGYNAYPIAEMSVQAEKAAGDAHQAIGLTLNQTLAYDENEENLLRYPLKKDELQCVLPGQVVPVLTRGLVLLNADAFATAPAVGDAIVLDTAVAGLLEKDPGDGSGGHVVGRCLALGKDVQMGADGNKVKYLCKVSF